MATNIETSFDPIEGVCGGPPTLYSRRRAGKINLVVEQGASFEFPIEYKEDDAPVDLTDCVAVCQFKQRVDQTDVLIQASVVITNPAQGKMVLNIEPSQTLNLTVFEGVWDLIITFPDERVVRLLEGKFKVSRGVSRG